MQQFQDSSPVDSRTNHPAKRRGLAAAAALAVLAVLVCFLLISLFAVRGGGWPSLAAWLTHRDTNIDLSSTAVVDKIRMLSRLETVDYSIDKIVEGNETNPVLPNFLAGDKLLLIAHGEVIAGIDMSQLKPSDVKVDGTTIHVQLPAPQVLVTRIDNAKSRVYSRTTGLLVAADPNLESQVRLSAEQEITKAALADGLLDKARQNGRNSVTSLLYALGFHSVDVQ